MTQDPFFRQMKPFPQLIMLMGITVALAIIFSLIAHVLIKLIFGFSVEEILQLSHHLEDSRSVAALKVVQITSQIGIFLLPPILFAKFTQTASITQYYHIRPPGNPYSAGWAIMSVFTIIPLIGALSYWNMSIDLPESLGGIEQWMQDKEEANTAIMKAFLNTGTVAGLLLNLLMIAILPALGEELIFRGALQKVLHRLFSNPHAGIFATALIFSAVHMQFYGFLPRFVLGLLLGYAYFFSKNLWMPIIIHFVNNAFAVTLAFLYYNDHIQQNYNELALNTKAFPAVLSLLLTAYVVYRIYLNESATPPGKRIDYGAGSRH